MLKTFTLVKMQPGFDRDRFYARWCQHTRDLDLRDHPKITLNRLVMFEEGGPYLGLAENHWPDREALDEAIAFYQTPAGELHQKDLDSFMDTAASPTVIVSDEVEVSDAKGIDWLIQAGQPR